MKGVLIVVQATASERNFKGIGSRGCIPRNHTSFYIMETKIIARVNNIAIIASNEPEKYVPIKPICDILGIDRKSQQDKIKDHPILSSVGVLSTLTGADGKQYEMFCLPLEFVFGWLFTINSSNVAPEAKEAVEKYQLECYRALYHHFTAYSRFNEAKQKRLASEYENYQSIQENFNKAKQELTEAKKRMDAAKELTFEEWEIQDRQQKLNFDEE